ncbi:glutamate-5-semialdehyde dehydrogenase [Natronobacillus azotifigens]|uniref:Gamma-glutamyl phosphate reductase n=1 Tax=Natronobacillus azotifigens TaxID=472978 RepID=A0A9J6R8K2_9BACI|nr:glutamate-5-semialdehyde dehydrogenase [Natronobacillus azotifigens]MCZ0701986.1 glutamate-5-semialdehyde dehydrogenase [Natronobacillus azotifigens]
MTSLIEIAKQAKQATTGLAKATTANKNDALHLIAQELIKQQDAILHGNQKDLDSAVEKGISASVIDRIRLTPERIETMAQALHELVELDDPIRKTLDDWKRPNGLQITKIAVPIGVIGIIYEARPNVTVDAASLCLKTGNAVILRGSSSAIHSNTILVKVIQDALAKSELPTHSVQLIEDTSRATAEKMFRLNEYLDVLIPRGSKQLIDTVVEKSSVPVLETGAGNCHLYIDQTANVEMAIEIAINAKTQRPSVCNAIETILVERGWFEKNGEQLVRALIEKDVTVRGDELVLAQNNDLELATEDDWHMEYLDTTVSMKIVDDVHQAIEHINRYGTHHSEAIISEDQNNVVSFLNQVDAACVYHNASTRFTDGFEFGFGAEIGISTQKLHARGPMGLEALTSTKYVLYGDGQIK